MARDWNFLHGTEWAVEAVILYLSYIIKKLFFCLELYTSLCVRAWVTAGCAQGSLLAIFKEPSEEPGIKRPCEKCFTPCIIFLSPSCFTSYRFKTFFLLEFSPMVNSSCEQNWNVCFSLFLRPLETWVLFLFLMVMCVNKSREMIFSS